MYRVYIKLLARKISKQSVNFKILYLNSDIYKHFYFKSSKHPKHSLILLIYCTNTTNKLHSLLLQFFTASIMFLSCSSHGKTINSYYKRKIF